MSDPSTSAAENVREFLRSVHGPYRTAALAAEATGIKECTVRKWLELKATPSMTNFLAMVEAYGPSFLVAVIDDPASWLRAAALDRTRDSTATHLSATRKQIDTDFSRLQASLAPREKFA